MKISGFLTTHVLIDQKACISIQITKLLNP